MLKKVKDNIAAYLLGFALVAFLFAYISWLNRRDDQNLLTSAKASLTWPHTKGKITGGHVEEESGGIFSRPARSRYHARPHYTYKVKDKTYKATRLCFRVVNCGFGGTKETARKLLGEYQKGSPVSVYYNPKNPSESVLRPGGDNYLERDINEHTGQLRISLPIGALLLIIGLLAGARFGFGIEETPRQNGSSSAIQR